MAPKKRKKRGRNKGWFKKGHDPRRRVGFTKEEAKRGYLAALEATAHDVHKHAWLFRRVRSYFRAQRREHGEEKDDRGHVGPADGGDDIPW